MHNYPLNDVFLDHNMKLCKMIEIYLKYYNMHTNKIFNALNYINNHVNSCTNCILSTLPSGPHLSGPLFVDLSFYLCWAIRFVGLKWALSPLGPTWAL